MAFQLIEIKGICTSEEEIQDEENECTNTMASLVLEENQQSMVRHHSPLVPVEKCNVSFRTWSIRIDYIKLCSIHCK